MGRWQSWTLAKLGVAVFAVALIAPAIAYDISRGATVLVASSSMFEAGPPTDVSLPNQVAGPRRRALAEPPGPAIAQPAAQPAAIAPPAPQGAPPPPAFVRGSAVVTASWYGPGFYGNRLPCWQWLLANGLSIQLGPETWGVAHKTLPCGTMLTLTHGANTITVPVVDRGPYVAGRELDLAPRVKAALGCSDLCTVVMQIP